MSRSHGQMRAIAMGASIVIASGAFVTVAAPASNAAAVTRHAAAAPATSAAATVPVPVVSAGREQACGIRSIDATLRCWGAPGAIVSQVPSGTFTAVSTGVRQACAIATTGTLTCWGEQLTPGTPSAITTSAPTDAVTAVSVGHDWACAIKAADSSLVCWGDGSPTLPTVPTGAMATIVLSDSTTGQTACGLVAASTHAAVCFGTDSAVTAVPASTSGYRSLDVGDGEACAVVFGNRLPRCWGRTPIPSTSPARAFPAGTFSAVAVGVSYLSGTVRDVACLISATANTVQCTNGTTTETSPPELYSSITAGGETYCGITSARYISCWGSDSQGQNGTPIALTGPALLALSTVDCVAPCFQTIGQIPTTPGTATADDYKVVTGNLPPGMFVVTDVGSVPPPGSVSGEPFMPGTYTTTIAVSDGLFAPLRQAMQVTIGSGTTRIPVIIRGDQQHSSRVGRFARRMRVQVVNSYGWPMPGVNVKFQAPMTTTAPTGTFSNGTHTATVRTKNDGVVLAPAFTANSIAGSIAVTATAKQDNGTAAGTTSFTLTNGGTANATISGTVRGPGGTSPLSNACVEVWKPNMAGLVATATTGASGVYTVKVAAGSYLVRAATCMPSTLVRTFSGSALSYLQSPLVTAAAKKTHSGVDITMAQGGTVSGKVTENGLAPASGRVGSVKVMLTDFSAGWCADVDSSGNYVLAGIPANTPLYVGFHQNCAGNTVQYDQNFYVDGVIDKLGTLTGAQTVTVDPGATLVGINHNDDAIPPDFSGYSQPCTPGQPGPACGVPETPPARNPDKSPIDTAFPPVDSK